MNKPLRVLHVFNVLNYGGAEVMIMDLYRKIDRKKIQFDFVVHSKEKGLFEDEILEMGGKIFRVPLYKGINHLTYVKSWKKLLNNNSDFSIIHGHVRSTASIYLKIAKSFNVITIAHSHSTTNGNGFS